MANHTIHFNYDSHTNSWSIKEHDEHNVKAKQTIEWKTNKNGHNIQVKFRAGDTVVSPSQLAVPGTATVSANPTVGTHLYDATVDGQPVGVSRSAPGIIIE